MNVANLQANDQMVGAPQVSIIIPSYNSASHIRQCLATLRVQRTTIPYEVILVDSSDDGTDHIVGEEFPEVRLFHFAERCSVGKARNIGVEQARAEVVLFLDTDCIPAPNIMFCTFLFLARLLASFLLNLLLNAFSIQVIPCVTTIRISLDGWHPLGTSLV